MSKRKNPPEPINDPKAFEPANDVHQYFRIGNSDVLLPMSLLDDADRRLLFKLSNLVGGMTLDADQVTRLKKLRASAIYL